MGAAILSWYPDPYAFDVKNTRRPASLGIRYVLSGMKAPVLWSSLVCAVYTGVECTMEQLRDETHSSTYVNSSAAGAAAGLVMGSMSRRLDVMAASALGLGLLMGMVEYNGQTVVGDAEHAKLKWDALLPPKTKDSTTVEDLKKIYPEFKDL